MPEQTLRVVVSVVDAITASVKSVEVLDTTVDLLVSVVNRLVLYYDTTMINCCLVRHVVA